MLKSRNKGDRKREEKEAILAPEINCVTCQHAEWGVRLRKRWGGVGQEVAWGWVWSRMGLGMSWVEVKLNIKLVNYRRNILLVAIALVCQVVSDCDIYKKLIVLDKFWYRARKRAESYQWHIRQIYLQFPII